MWRNIYLTLVCIVVSKLSPSTLKKRIANAAIIFRSRQDSLYFNIRYNIIQRTTLLTNAHTFIVEFVKKYNKHLYILSLSQHSKYV